MNSKKHSFYQLRNKYIMAELFPTTEEIEEMFDDICCFYSLRIEHLILTEHDKKTHLKDLVQTQLQNKIARLKELLERMEKI